MKKLIETRFEYTTIEQGSTQVYRGSYLGKKEASVATLRRFLRKNAKEYDFAENVKAVAVRSITTSPWILK